MSDLYKAISGSIGNKIEYFENLRTGEITADNGDGTYDVKIANADSAMPNVETLDYDMTFGISEIVVIGFEYGCKESPKILGSGKKIAQEPKIVEVDYSGGARVKTLNAYSTTAATTYLNGEISITANIIGNCTRRGFHYGTDTDYGSPDEYEDGSFGAGTYTLQIEGLNANTTYHYQAYVLDANGDEQVGEDKTMTTSAFIGLISCDLGTRIIYLHSGTSSGISSSFSSPGLQPEGLAYDGTNLISCDVNDGKIYVHDKISSGITNSFNSPETYSRGLAFDGTNLISCDDDTNKIYVHDGVSSGITNSFDSPSGTPRGLAFDGTNLISSDIGTDTIYIHNGVSSGISSNFSSPASRPEGLAYDGTNLISCNPDTNKIYIHNGISSGVSSNFASPDTWPTGITYIS